MLSSFLEKDEELYLRQLSTKTLIEELTIDDVKNFLISLGLTEDKLDIRGEEVIILPTICHNPISSLSSSMKLYWYQNYKLFHCYTQCGDNMTIFELYRRFVKINFQKEIDLSEAELSVKKIITSKHKINVEEIITNDHLIIDLERFKKKNQLPKNPVYSKYILDRFINYHHPLWKEDGITDEAMDKFDIRFFIQQNKIVIPHYDINGNLIGIRGRALNEDEVNNGRKYMPININNEFYNHPTGQNLYGIYENKDAIKTFRRAIIVEGEKSVMLNYCYDKENSLAVACCGHNISIYQINLLRTLGVQEVTIAFDKEYDDVKDEDAKKDKEHIMKLCNKYKHLMNFSYIWDRKNRLKRKQSPMDCGKETWEQLYRERIVV